MLAPLTAAAIFLVLTIEPGGEDAVRDLLADWAGLQRAVGFRVPEAPLACVAGIGSGAWDRLFSGPRPAELHPFRELAGTVHRAVSTPGDLLFHIRHERMDVCFEFASQVMTRLAGAVTVADEVHGFRYWDERDLLGFVDGTENPVGAAAGAAALTGDAICGRSLLRRRQLRHRAEVPARHGRVERADHRGPGEGDRPHQAVRHRAAGRRQAGQLARRAEHHRGPGRHRTADPAGQHAVRRAGTRGVRHLLHRVRRYPGVTEQMLVNMFIGNPPGNTDRILDFSTAVTGCLFFVPSADFLDDLPDPPGVPPVHQIPAGEPDSGSLGIGSLKRSNPS